VGELDDLSGLVDEIRYNIDLLYQLIMDAKYGGHTYDQLQDATGLARGTLQNIVAGKAPRICP
jgi:hypothetical protein